MKSIEANIVSNHITGLSYISAQCSHDILEMLFLWSIYLQICFCMTDAFPWECL